MKSALAIMEWASCAAPLECVPSESLRFCRRRRGEAGGGYCQCKRVVKEATQEARATRLALSVMKPELSRSRQSKAAFSCESVKPSAWQEQSRRGEGQEAKGQREGRRRRAGWGRQVVGSRHLQRGGKELKVVDRALAVLVESLEDAVHLQPGQGRARGSGEGEDEDEGEGEGKGDDWGEG